MTNIATRRFHAPLSEKMDDELVYAIGQKQADQFACRMQLRRNGWTDAQIDAAVQARADRAALKAQRDILASQHEGTVGI